MSNSYVKGALEFEYTSIYNEKNLIVSKEEKRVFYYGEKYIQKTLFSYDQKNNLIKVQDLKDGILLNTTDFEYDTNGKLLSENSKKTGSLQHINSNFVGSNKSQKLFYDNDGTISGKEEKEFDLNGNVIKNVTFGPKEKVFMIENRSYSLTGKLLEENKTEVLANNTILKTFIYDKKDNLLEERTVQNGKMTSRTAYEYDVKNNLIRKQRYNSNNTLDYYFEYVYGSKDQLQTETFYYQNLKYSVINYNYDTVGNKIKEEHIDKDGSILRIKNWVYLCK